MMRFLQKLRGRALKTMRDESPILLNNVQEALIMGLFEAEKFFQDNKDKTPVEYFKAMKPYIDDIASTQTKHLVYLPAVAGIYLLVRYFKPKVAGETGVEMGRSTYAFLKGMNLNKLGHLDSIDIAKLWAFHPEYHGGDGDAIPQTTIAPLVPEWFKHRWTFHNGDSKRIMKDIVENMGAIDMYFIGDDHSYAPQIFETDIVWPHLKSGGIYFWDRPDYNDDHALNEFLEEHKDEVLYSITMLESRPTDKYTFTILLKK